MICLLPFNQESIFSYSWLAVVKSDLQQLFFEENVSVIGKHDHILVICEVWEIIHKN